MGGKGEVSSVGRVILKGVTERIKRGITEAGAPYGQAGCFPLYSIWYVSMAFDQEFKLRF